MHFTVCNPCPTVISNNGMLLRVCSSVEPRTSPITDAIVPRLQRADRHRVQAVFIPKWQMVQQVLDGLDPTLGELDRDPFAHPASQTLPV